METYQYIDRDRRMLVIPNFGITYIIMNKYYPGEPVNKNIHSLINIMQENNCLIPSKNR